MRMYNEEQTVSSTSGSGITGQLHVKQWLEHFLKGYTKINSKRDAKKKKHIQK